MIRRFADAVKFKANIVAVPNTVSAHYYGHYTCPTPTPTAGAPTGAPTAATTASAGAPTGAPTTGCSAKNFRKCDKEGCHWDRQDPGSCLDIVITGEYARRLHTRCCAAAARCCTAAVADPAP